MNSKLAMVAIITLPTLALACGQSASPRSEDPVDNVSQTVRTSSVLRPRPGVARGDRTSEAAKAMSQPIEAFAQKGASSSVSPSGKR
jgi:hypothetical protein